MAERFGIVLLLVVIVLLGWGALRLWKRSTLRRLAEERPLLPLVPLGKPAIVAFSTADCADCRTRQAPALRRLATEVEERVLMTSLDATEQTELVTRLGILTVPATVIVDERGVVRHLNLGFASEGTLRAQIAPLILK